MSTSAEYAMEKWECLLPRGGGVIQARISTIQILYENFVRNLFGVFKALCR